MSEFFKRLKTVAVPAVLVVSVVRGDVAPTKSAGTKRQVGAADAASRVTAVTRSTCVVCGTTERHKRAATMTVAVASANGDSARRG